MFLAVVPEARPMPNVADGVPVDVSHAGVGGNIVTANHHIAATVDVQSFKNERAGYLVGVEIDAWIGGPRRIKSGIDSPSQKLAFDEIVHAHFLDPISLDRVDVDTILINPGRYDLRRAAQLIAHANHAANVEFQLFEVEAFADNVVGSLIAGVDRKLDKV